MVAVKLTAKSHLIIKLSKGTFWYVKEEGGFKSYSLLGVGWKTDSDGLIILFFRLLWLSVKLGIYHERV
jgi:hypothetical protein